MDKINKVEQYLKENYLIIVFIVSLALHLGEAVLTAVSYSESILRDSHSTTKWVITWLTSVIIFVGVAAVSFATAIALPHSFRNIGYSIEKKRGVVEAIALLFFIGILYLSIQYFFLYVNMVLSDIINSEAAITSINIIGLKLNPIQREGLVTTQQVHSASIEMLIVYINVGFEILLSLSFLYLHKMDDEKK